MKKMYILVLLIIQGIASRGQCVTPTISLSMLPDWATLSYGYPPHHSCFGQYYSMTASVNPPVGNYSFQWQYLDSVLGWVDHVNGVYGANGATTKNLVLSNYTLINNCPWIGAHAHRFVVMQPTCSDTSSSIETRGIRMQAFQGATIPQGPFCLGDTIRATYYFLNNPDPFTTPVIDWYFEVNQTVITSGNSYLPPAATMSYVAYYPRQDTINFRVNLMGCATGISYSIVRNINPCITPCINYIDSIRITDSLQVVIKDSLHITDSLQITMRDSLRVVDSVSIERIIESWYVVTECGVADTFSECSILIYPNPTENNCSIYFPQNTEARYIIELFDMAGQRVLRYYADYSGDPYLLKLAHVQAGEYLLLLRSADSQWVCKIIKL